MASGLWAALTGRTHGCTDQPANVKKTLANSEPSTHGTKRTYRGRLLFCLLSGVKRTYITVQLRPSRSRLTLNRHKRGG